MSVEAIISKKEQYYPIDKSDNFVYTKYIRKEMENMKTNLQKWGNSQGIRIPKTILETLDWTENEQVEISVEDEKVVIKKVENHKRKNINELFENYDGEYNPVSIDWGKPEGNEIW